MRPLIRLSKKREVEILENIKEYFIKGEYKNYICYIMKNDIGLPLNIKRRILINLLPYAKKYIIERYGNITPSDEDLVDPEHGYPWFNGDVVASRLEIINARLKQLKNKNNNVTNKDNIY